MGAKKDQIVTELERLVYLRDMAHKAAEISPLVKRALDVEQSFRQKTSEELDVVMGQIQNFSESDNADVIVRLLGQRQLTDIEWVKRLNTALAELSDKEPSEIGFPLRTNKMLDILVGAENFGQEHTKSLLAGKVPEGYRYRTTTTETTVLGWNDETIWGNSKGSFLKATALTLAMQSKNDTRLQEWYAKEGTVESSALVHTIPFPSVLRRQWVAGSSAGASTYYFSDTKTDDGLLYIHSGYAFGGHRFETRYPIGKQYGPEDCSSFVSKILNVSVAFSVADQLCYYRMKLEPEAFIPPAWSTGPEVVAFTETLEPMIVRDPQKDIRPGQIYAHCRFDLEKDPDKSLTLGQGKHTTLVLGFKSDGANSSVVTLGANRDMPNIEGLGIQEFPLEVEGTNKKILFFSTKGNELKDPAQSKRASQDLKFTVAPKPGS